MQSSKLPVEHGFLRPERAPPPGALCPKLAYGSRVLLLTDDGPEGPPVSEMDADGIVSARANSLLALPVADCIPVLISDDRGP